MASGFANHACQWWVDSITPGNVLNGGGFDATVTNAGTNYADANSPIVTSIIGASNNSTTFTDGGNPFTNLMIGNVLRISAKSTGDAAALDYFMITAFGNSGSITLDRAPTSTTGLTGATYRIGGRHPNLQQYAAGGTGTPQPTLASPAIPGNQINLRGNGSLDSATIDYDLSAGYWNFPSGTNTASLSGGSIKLVGYNGRPNIGHCGLISDATNLWWIKHVKMTQTVGTFTTQNLFNQGSTSFYDCIGDLGGFDSRGPGFCEGPHGGTNNVGASMSCCEIRNTGGGAAGTGAGADHFHGGGFFFANWIHGIRGDGICATGVFGSHFFNLVQGNKRYGFNDLETDVAKPIQYFFMNNTFDANVSIGFNIAAVGMVNLAGVWNNIFSNHTTAFAFADSLAVNTQRYRFMQYNDYYNNTTNFSGSPAGWGLNKTVDAGLSGDLTLNPTYANSAGNDFTPTANVLNTGLAWCSNFTTTPYTLAMGAIQP